MYTAVDILENGVRIARKAMRSEAQEWRLLTMIGARRQFRAEAISRAEDARDVALGLQRVLDEQRAVEANTRGAKAPVPPPTPPTGPQDAGRTLWERV